MEVVGVDIAGRVDLEAVVVLVRILEQAVHRVQHLVRHREEPFEGHSTVFQALLTLKTLVCGNEHIEFSTSCDTMKNHSRATLP